MVELIDKRGKPLTHSFRNLEIGQCYQDTENYICMKVSKADSIRYIDGSWKNHWVSDVEELVIPLKTTITIEREENS